MVRAFAHGTMSRRIDPSWGGSIELFLVTASAHDWCNKGRGMCYPVCGDGAYKRTLAVNRKEKLMWQQRVSFLTIRMVLNYMYDAI